MPENDHGAQRVRPEQYPALISALGDTPETVVAAHVLTRRLCRAYTAGELARFQAAIVESELLPREPWGFGEDAESLRGLLRVVPDWDCVLVSDAVAPKLSALIEAETGKSVRHFRKMHHTLPGTVGHFRDEAVRELTPEDLDLLRANMGHVWHGHWADAAQMLQEGIAAGAIVDGRLVSLAFTAARTPRHADMATETLEGWRGRGFATAAASIVARRVRESGQIPVWRPDEANRGSQRIAHKLGFSEVSRWTYLIPARDR